MNKETEKQPIDDLFARKLSNMSLPPSPDGFERLQKRLALNEPDKRIVFWRNPSVQRYGAAAACLLLVSLLGWLYRQPNEPAMSGRSQVATNYTLPRDLQKPIKSQSDQVRSRVSGEPKEDKQIALAEEPTGHKRKSLTAAQFDKTRKPVIEHRSVHSEPILTQVELAKATVDAEKIRSQQTAETSHLATEQIASGSTTVKPNAPAERVLIVTIEEPASLVAARQTAQKFVEEKPALPIDDKETKGGIWNQVRRFKEGELFARHNDGTTNDRGLLDRAYNGLRHSMDKNKPAKQ